MNDKNIWGCMCDCGNEAFDYFDEHPWCGDKSILKTVTCSKCGRTYKIDCVAGEDFYNQKVLECFKDIYGNVLEIGCGGGFISNYVMNLKDVNYLVTIDKDEESICRISDKHYQLDLNNFDENVFETKFDFIICRDVLMYLDDVQYTFEKLSKISNKIVLLNWYDINHKNCLNKTSPLKVLEILNKYYKNLDIQYPYFYKKGYLIKSRI